MEVEKTKFKIFEEQAIKGASLGIAGFLFVGLVLGTADLIAEYFCKIIGYQKGIDLFGLSWTGKMALPLCIALTLIGLLIFQHQGELFRKEATIIENLGLSIGICVIVFLFIWLAYR